MPDLAAERLTDIFVLFLVLSVVFEVALTPVFNWRLFVKHCEGKGWKTPIAVGTAFVVFWTQDLDIFSQILNAFEWGGKSDRGIQFGGQILTAFLIAGGSDGVFRIFKRLKLRDPLERQKKAKQERNEI